MAHNTNRIRNGGFEQSSPGTDPGPFWTAGGIGVFVETGNNQLLGNNNVVLINNDGVSGGGSISQQLLPLQIGEIYEFRAGFRSPATVGTVDINITGQPTRSFQAANLVNTPYYGQYHFTFEATIANPTLTITNNSDTGVWIDVVSVFLK